MQYHYVSDKELYHFGRSKRDGAPVGSGRYPLGSGEARLSRRQQKKNYKHIKKQLKKTGGKLDSKTINELQKTFDKNVSKDDQKNIRRLKNRVTEFEDKYEKLRYKLLSDPDFSNKVDIQMKKDGLDPDDRHRGYWEEAEFNKNKELNALSDQAIGAWNELISLEDEKYSKAVKDYIGKYANKNINYITKSAIYGDVPHFGTIDEVLRRYFNMEV